jgi:two-component system, OmpR family, response regulator
MKDKFALIIDDEIDICVLLSGILKQNGIKATFTTTLTQGISKLSLSDFDVLFLDNNLPDGSGLDTMKEIKNLHPKLRIIMISAYDGDKERDTAHKNGAYFFLGKPLTTDMINGVLKNLYPEIN